MSSKTAESITCVPVAEIQRFWGDKETVTQWLEHPFKQIITHTIREPVVKALKRLPKNSLVLDIACGANPFSYFSKETRKHIVMLDISPEMLKLNCSQIKVIADARRKLPFPKNTFEMITCILGLRYFENQEETLADIVRVLKPSGKAIIIDTPNNQTKNAVERPFLAPQLAEFCQSQLAQKAESQTIMPADIGLPRLDMLLITKQE